MNTQQKPKTELEKRIETMRMLERTYARIGQDNRARDMRQRRQDLEAVVKSMETNNRR